MKHIRNLLLATGLLAAAAAMASPTVEMQTTMGTIVIELDSEKAPITVKNFLQYAGDGFYNGTVFHRVIDGFMIQGGGFGKDMAEKPTSGTIANESKNGLSNRRGTIAMARRAEPNSASSQFFINHKDNSGQLDYPSNGGGYAVFGKVVSGMDIVDKIAKVPTGNRAMHQNVPTEPVVIVSVKITPDKK
ncbi:MAG: Peptidylprolyl isomerase [Proteobacteria bacterium]|nr:Peptidylprolyl isomerase [Pseudomonadota bacterium]